MTLLEKAISVHPLSRLPDCFPQWIRHIGPIWNKEKAIGKDLTESLTPFVAMSHQRDWFVLVDDTVHFGSEARGTVRV